jgi:hypothetical protein
MKRNLPVLRQLVNYSINRLIGWNFLAYCLSNPENLPMQGGDGNGWLLESEGLNDFSELR